MNRLFFTSALLVFLFACGSNSRQDTTDEIHEPVSPPQYFYYPRANVYFDSANKDYFFSSDDSGTWQSAKQIPSVVLALMDKSIEIKNPPDPVWKDNENHKLVYASVLYATPNDTVAKKKVVKSVPRVMKDTAAADSAATVVKERKGLGKFFDKVFGRNKKKKKEAEDAAKIPSQ